MRYLFCLIIIVGVNLEGAIVETAHFSDISSYGDSGTLILLDIDDTLIVPIQTVGTDVWYQYQLGLNQAADMKDPLDATLALWEALRHVSKMKIVEEGTERIVADLQGRGVTLIALTTQGLALATRTVNQLASLGFDLTKTAPRDEDCYFLNGRGVLFRKGILFTSGTHKGQALMKFLEQINIHPQRVVFINDKYSHLKEVEDVLNETDMEFIGLRYSFSDRRVNSFDPEIAKIQLAHSSFLHVLSDEEAEALRQ